MKHEAFRQPRSRTGIPAFMQGCQKSWERVMCWQSHGSWRPSKARALQEFRVGFRVSRDWTDALASSRN